MIALMIGTSIAAAAALTWYGRKALNRIERWGERMNEQDAIFQNAASEEERNTYAPTAQSQSVPAKVVNGTGFPLGIRH